MTKLNDLIIREIGRCSTLNDVDNAHKHICRLVKVKDREKYIDILVGKEVMIREVETFKGHN